MYQIFKFILITNIIFSSYAYKREGNNINFKKEYSLTIQVEGILIKKGFIYIAIYNNEKDFLISPYIKKKIKVNDFLGSITFKKLQVGEYAVTMYQDLNGNGKLDKLFSVPLEPYGLSNNPSSFPIFNKLKFNINKDETIKIKIRN